MIVDTERKWLDIAPRSFTANGTANGIVTIADTIDFKVKQKVIISATGLQSLTLEVKRVLSSTQLIVGPTGQPIKNKTDISAYTTALNANIEANEQDRSNIPPDEHERAVYHEEPIRAKRVIYVDPYGRYYNVENPIPVRLSDGSVNIGTVNAELEVQLSHIANTPNVGDVPDSVQVGDGVEIIQVNPDGSINVKVLNTASGNPVVYLEADTFTDTTETTVATYVSTNNGTNIMKISGDAVTYGTWKAYFGSVSNVNLKNVFRTSPTQRNAELVFAQPQILNNAESIIVTFQADIYRSSKLGASGNTFTRVEGYYQ